MKALENKTNTLSILKLTLLGFTLSTNLFISKLPAMEKDEHDKPEFRFY